MSQAIDNSQFKATFTALTGHPPLSWQERLYNKHFASGDLPSVIDIPTGLGKTMVMALWLIARAQCRENTPTRLIYVVDRRTVVDQATDVAENFTFLLAPDSNKLGKDQAKSLERIANRNSKLNELKRDHAEGLQVLRGKLGLDDDLLAISTLRGQLADNREWSRDPSRPAIIIGTVDLIGSGLLFSGYRSSSKRRPLEAGLLGQDSLLVLDEAHLSRPFEELLVGRKDADEKVQKKGIVQFQSGRDKPLCVIRMSATTADGNAKRFKLEQSDLADPIIEERYTAKKTLSITSDGNVVDSIATAAGKLTTDHPGTRIVIFVQTPKQVDDVRKALVKHEKSRETRIAMLTGTMRGLERDELVTPPTDESQHKRHVMQRFLEPDNDPSLGECFLISTSAGEVGFDLNADHMVCDATTIDSLIQRLGRVNRRGLGEAQVHLFAELPKKEKDGKLKKLEALDLAIANTIGLLQGVEDVSPKNIAALKSGMWKDTYADACSPVPTMVDLTDILLDAWSMTSITERMPGRPEVGPWLRGIADDLPQTTIAWRAELDEPGFADLDLGDVEEWFDTHRILTHETLSVPTSVAATWLTDRWGHFDDKQKSEVGGRPIVVDRSGLKLDTVKELIDQLNRKNTDSIRFADLILPASFGGIERDKGMLDADAPEVPKDESKQSAEDRAKALASRQAAPDVADLADGLQRQREIVTKTEDGESQSRIIGGGTPPPNPAYFRIELTSDDDRTIRLVSHVQKREKPEYGSEKQTLQQHVGAVRKAVDDIISRLSLPDDFKLVAQLAADWHDHGKNRERWQRTVGGTATVGTTNWMQQTKLEGDDKHQCLGKSGGEMKRDSRGYRHEFGSLREFTDAFTAGKLLDNTGKPISSDVFDLAMHLIAVHHGRGRPHFPKGGFDPDCESRSDEIHTESIRRFARLQRTYGWWRLAWLENLLRCADAMASADNDIEDDTADTTGGKGGQN